jgi:predicted dehydrogenase
LAIRVGIFGLGTQDGALSIGAWGVIAHLKSIQALPEYEIVAVANSTVESAKRTIARWTFSAETKAYGNPEGLARDPNIDLAVVSVNVAKHYKKNVFVEWPLGASFAETEELTKLAAAEGVKTMVGTQGQADPSVQRLRVLLEEGEIGRVLRSTSVVCNGMTPIDTWLKGVENYLDFKSGGNKFDIHFAHCKSAWIF